MKECVGAKLKCLTEHIWHGLLVSLGLYCMSQVYEYPFKSPEPNFTHYFRDKLFYFKFGNWEGEGGKE